MNDNVIEVDSLEGYQIPFFQAPNEIFELGLTNYQIVVYLYLQRCGNNGKTAFPSYKTIGTKCGISRRKAIDVVNELIEFNLIVKKYRLDEKGDNNSNIYKIMHPSAYCAPPTQCTTCTTLVNDMHHPSAQGSPNKELPINNSLEKTNLVVVEAFSKAKDKSLTKAEKDKLIELSNNYSEGLILKAIDMTVEQAEHFNIKYIRTILESFKAKGLNTLQEVETWLENDKKAVKKGIENKRNKLKDTSESKSNNSWHNHKADTNQYTEYIRQLEARQKEEIYD